MFSKKSQLILFTFILLNFRLLNFASADESITITTFYPTPSGVFSELQATKLAIGDNYFDITQYCWTGICGTTIDAAADLVVEGNVGIGTVTPVALSKLTISDLADSTMVIQSGIGFNASLDFYRDNWNTWSIGNRDTASGQDFYIEEPDEPIATRTRFAILGGIGNVGIGTTTPTATLHVKGNDVNPEFIIEAASAAVRFNDTNNDDWRITTANDTSRLWFENETIPNTAMMMEVNAAGTAVNVGIENCYFLNDAYQLSVFGNLYVEGAAYKTGAFAWEVPSDIRLKDIKGDYLRGLSEIIQIKPVRFQYKKNNELNASSDKEYIGLIAQEVQKVIPEAVNIMDNGYLSLNGDPINWALINSIKELNIKIKFLEENNNVLNHTLNLLEEKLNQLETKFQKKEI